MVIKVALNYLQENLVVDLIFGEKGLVKLLEKILKRLLQKQRSTKTLNHYSEKDIDMLIINNEKCRDDLEEFVKIVPDECLIDLSDKVYCK